MPGMNKPPKKTNSLNIFKGLVSKWDRHSLEKAMQTAEESMPERIPLSFRFIDQVKHYHCQIFRSGYHFFIGGCEVHYSPVIPLYPEMILEV
jgi:hypothetical protein